MLIHFPATRRYLLSALEGAPDLFEQMRHFRERRATISAFLEALSTEQWEGVCLHPLLGRLSLEGLAILVSVHDS